jgi:ABC-2 type transport system ATP-binding protein
VTTEKDALDVRNLTKRFGPIVAVNDLSFNVAKGEIFGFLGPNGAGKTTTIRMLTGLLTPDTGEVRVQGIDVYNDPIRAKMAMGIIPEMSNVYIELTARQNVVLAGRFYGKRKRDVEVEADRLLKQFELDERKDDRVQGFSKGMKQRVLIASALVHAPQVLFLDEPTSGLDVHSQRLIRTTIREMHREGTTVFLTTHNIEEASALCDRVGIIHRGTLAAIDTPEQLKKAFQETQSVEVAWDRPINGYAIAPPALVNRVEKMGDKWRFFTTDPDQLIKHLISLAQKEGLNVTSLNTYGASLEDAFVKVTEEGPRES